MKTSEEALKMYVVTAKDKSGNIRRGVLYMPKETAEAMCINLSKVHPELQYWAAPVVEKVEMTASEILECEG